ncbi:MAG: phosphopantetheine-binding protein [Nitrospirota bacterium]
MVAYIVSKSGSTINIKQLRNFLTVRLPSYMMPSAFVFLDSLPMTPNKKVDRKALPVPDRFIQRPGNAYTAPKSELEVQLAGIWESILRVRPVGTTDNFFELGGHSLLAVRLVSEIRKITGKDFPVMALFHNPTIEKLCVIITEKKWAVRWSSVVKVRESGSHIPLFCVHSANLARFMEPTQPLYILTRPSKDDNLAPYSTIAKIAKKNILEMRTVRPKGPYVITGNCLWAVVALEMAHQLIMQGEEVPFLFLVEPPDICLGNQTDQESAVRSRLISHGRNLGLFRNSEKIEYIARKFLGLIKRKTSRGYINYMVKIIVCKTYLFFGQLPPHDLRRFYLYAYHANKIIKSYIPWVYPGKAVVFYADKMSADVQQWSKFVSGGVEVHEVPGAGHIDILGEPYVNILAGIIGKCLNTLPGNDVKKQL